MEINNFIEENRNEGLELLKKLVSIPSTSPDGEHYKEVIDVLQDFFSKYDVKTEVITVPKDYQAKHCKHAGENPRYILRAYVGKGRPWLQFNGHYDVVPGGPGWAKTSPFKPLVEGSIIYGRGTTDMKGGLTSMALAIAALSNTNLKGTVDAVFVPDEEIGGECGTGYYVEKLGDNLPDYAIIAEPSTTEAIWIGHKGGIWLKVEVEGKTAHASTPWLGKNAMIAAAKIIDWLEDKYVKQLSEKKSKYTYDLPDGNTPTAMIGGEAGVPGGKANQVPGTAYFTIDRRLIIEEDLPMVEKELNEYINRAILEKKIVGYNVKTTIMTKVNPAFVPPGNKLSTSIINAATTLGLPKPREIVCIGGLDLRYYSVKNVMAVSYGPGALKAAHAPDEYIDYDMVVDVAKVYSLLPEHLF